MFISWPDRSLAIPGLSQTELRVSTIVRGNVQEVKVTAEPLCASALRRGRTFQGGTASAPVPPRPASTSRGPGSALCSEDAAQSRTGLAFREMRGQGRGHTRWPVPLRSLLRALGPQDTTTRGLEQGKCEGDLGSPAHAGLADLSRAPLVLPLTAAHS